jgi:fructose/tagatose bisphosphate aldolase
MPLATPAQYAEMLDAAKAGGYAIPAVNVSSSSTLNAAIQGFVTAGSDGVVQVSRGGGDFAAGHAAERPLGARALADYAAVVAEQVPVLVVPHGDLCSPDERAAFGFVFHGVSGSTPDDIAELVRYGIVKMILDSEAQYAYTRAVADYMFVNYASVVRADCGIEDEGVYDARTWGRSAERAMAARVAEACHELGSAGRSLTRHAPRPQRA